MTSYMPIMMRVSVAVFVWLACACHGRRLSTSTGDWQGAEGQPSTSQMRAEVKQSQRQLGAEDLAGLLLAPTSAAAFNPSGPHLRSSVGHPSLKGLAQRPPVMSVSDGLSQVDRETLAAEPDTIEFLENRADVALKERGSDQAEADPGDLARRIQELRAKEANGHHAAIELKGGKVDRHDLELHALHDSYEQCRKITERASKTFSFGSALLTQAQKKAVWAIYTWCRRTDDLVDSPLAMMDAEKMTSDLSEWCWRLHKVWEGEATDVLDLALLDTKQRYPSLDIEPFFDMIEGMMMDTPQYGQTRYKTWDDLYLYCYRVASTVGLMTLPVLGTAPGYTEEQAKSPAIALGIALQITNILRDVGEDAKRGRIYLPQEDMARFNVTEGEILAGIKSERYVELMKFEIARARDYYRQAQDGIPMLAPASRLGVQAAGDIYGLILNKLEANEYDNFRKRAYVPGVEKLVGLLQSLQTVSQMS